MTPAEAKLWTYLSDSKLAYRKFRRQHSVGGYILDFYCPEERLGIELDGEVHFNEVAATYDYERKLFLQAFDIKVIRFENKLVFNDPNFVLGKIEASFRWREDEE